VIVDEVADRTQEGKIWLVQFRQSLLVHQVLLRKYYGDAKNVYKT